jgi:LysR family hydrogen peroxide-inducible transcriptional activator
MVFLLLFSWTDTSLPSRGGKIQSEFSCYSIVFSYKLNYNQLENSMAQIPTLRQLTYFIAVAETLSFLRAAERCSVTQPTLSGGLRDLEAILGEKLFERTSRSVTLTKTGQDLVLPAQDILARADEFVHIAQRHRAPLSGSLRMGIIPTIAPYLLPSLLPALQNNFPDLQLQLKEDLTAHLLQALERREIDIVLMAFPYDTPGMEQKILWSEPFLIATHGKNPVNPRPATINDLQKHTIMLLEDGHCLRDHALAACRLQPSSQRKTFGATSLATLIQMVQNGFGTTLLPAMAISPAHIPHGITLQRFANPQPSRDIGLAWRHGNPRRDEFRLLEKYIKKP